MAQAVIIGYGNALRRDDGLGPWIVRRLQAKDLPGVQALAVPQLTPELAEILADAELALFVDACADTGKRAVRMDVIETPEAGLATTHFSDPAALLALTRAVYGRAPAAWLIRVRGADFGLGTCMSKPARQAGRTALTQIEDLLRRETVSDVRDW